MVEQLRTVFRRNIFVYQIPPHLYPYSFLDGNCVVLADPSFGICVYEVSEFAFFAAISSRKRITAGDGFFACSSRTLRQYVR